MATQFENISDSLIWELTRRSNAFLVKRSEAGGVQLSRDPLNLLNKHSNKYSGLSNSRAIGIQASADNKLVFSTKTASKANKPATSAHRQTFGSGKSARNVSRTVVGATAKKGYRADLRAAAVSRVGQIKKSQRPVRERPQKVRSGKKSKQTEA